jgi:hypothetical protein
MLRRLAPLALLLPLALTACTAPTPTATPAPIASGGSVGTVGPAASGLPACEQIAPAVAAITAGLTFDESTSAAQTAQETYDQQVCVWTSADGASQVGVTLAALPFLQTELDAYGAMPGAIADDRLAAHGGVLETLAAGDGDDGILDSPLYLFDLEYSVTVQAVSTPIGFADGVDAAFAVRDLVN